MASKKQKDIPIIVAGVEITKERFPYLYRIAEISPENLERQLRGLNKLSGANDDNFLPEAINLEQDLQHG